VVLLDLVWPLWLAVLVVLVVVFAAAGIAALLGEHKLQAAVKLAYKPAGLRLGAGAGVLSGLIFKQVWTIAGHDDAPNATGQWPD
jgi:hypothetical protein